MPIRKTTSWLSLWIASMLVCAGLVCSCADSESDDGECEALDSYDEDDTVCCETYGLGAGGEKCCEQYEWMVAKDCPVSQTTGGGQRVVEDHCCD